MYPFENTELTVEERVHDLLHRLTLEEKIGLLATHQMPVERLGIGEWYVGHEVARGIVNREPENPTTVFPQPIGMAASFDKDMMLEIGKTAAREARAYYNERKNGGLMVWGPTVDMTRDPRWGRTEECYGEDPFLTGEMSVAYTRGLRGEGRVAATIPTLKHFCANNHEEGRSHENSNLNPRLKHEYYYAAFRPAITRGGAGSVMTAYNEICHAPAVMNHDLKHILKEEWGLGFVVTDGADFSQNVTEHGTFSSHARALQACLYAGADCMTDDAECVHAAARKALAEGWISEADLDLAIGNILKSRVELGHFDRETPYDTLTRADVNTEADKALNLRAAKEGMILLENNDILPLHQETCGTIGLFGPNGDCNLPDWYTGTSSYQISIRQGLENRGCRVIYDPGWDIVKLQGPNEKWIRIGSDGCLYADASYADAAQFYYCEHDAEEQWVNLMDVQSGRFVHISGNTPELGSTSVYGWFTSETLCIHQIDYQHRMISDYLHGRQFCLDAENRVICRPKKRPDKHVQFRIGWESEGTERLRKLAETVDTIIYCAGNDPQQVARECYDRKTIQLPPVQDFCASALAETGKPFVLLLVSSYPYALSSQLRHAGAVLYTSHAGPELGNAVASTLFGENNPAGRCPVTWYQSDWDLPDLRDYDIMKTRMTYLWFDGIPLYPFGYGMSYSTFVYTGLQTKRTAEGILISADITNTSDCDGDEVVQVYVHALSHRIPRPERKLCAFARLHIRAGETVRFSEIVPFRELEIYEVSAERFCLEEGEYTFFVGASSRDIRLQETLHVPGETVMPRRFSNAVRAELYDAEEHTEIYTDALTGETHVRGLQWENSLCFKNAELSGCREIRVFAAAPVEFLTISVYLDDATEPAAEIAVPSSDGFTDFKECTAPMTAQGCHDITLRFGQNCSIRSLQII